MTTSDGQYTIKIKKISLHFNSLIRYIKNESAREAKHIIQVSINKHKLQLVIIKKKKVQHNAVLCCTGVCLLFYTLL